MLLVFKMSLDLNVYREIFLVSFSILYGVMLQNMMGGKVDKKGWWQPFPWQQAYRDRIRRRRLLCSILVQNVGPFVYGIIVFWFLGFFQYGLESLQGWLLVFNVFWVALGVFGFQRLYGLLAIWKPGWFDKLHEIMKEQNNGRDPEWKPSLFSVAYYFASLISLLVSFIINPLGGIITVILTIIFLLLLFHGYVRVLTNLPS
jgi:hypothetical protein